MLDVLYQSSSTYAVPAAVSISSLLENNRDINQIKVWFINVGMSQEDIKALELLVHSYGREIEFIESTNIDEYLVKIKVERWKGSYATFYKVFSCCALPMDRPILYIDADTLVLGSLKEFEEFDFEDNAVAMVSSAMTKRVKEFFNLKQYHNAGVIYFNTRYWKQNSIEDTIREEIKKENITLVGDESLINVALKGKIKKLPLKYNFESSWWLWGWNKRLYRKLGFENEPYYSPKEVKRIQSNPIIAHYLDLTTGRPWDKYNDNIWSAEYKKYERKVRPWKKYDIPSNGIGANRELFLIGKYCIKKIMPFYIRSVLGFKQHDKAWKKEITQRSSDR